MTFPFHLPFDEAVGWDDEIVVRFTGARVSLNEETTDRIHDQLVALAEELGPARLFLDFRNVDYVSSLALGLLVRLHAKLRAAGGRLTIGNLDGQVHEVFAATHLDRLLDLRTGLAASLDQVRWIEVPSC
jgi:anti-anti-sigma factor